MGEKKKWGDAFATWLIGLPTGIKFVISLALALSTIVPAGLIVSVVAPLLFESDNQQVEISCSQDGSMKAYVSADDPRFQSIDVALIAMEACSTPFYVRAPSDSMP